MSHVRWWYTSAGAPRAAAVTPQNSLFRVTVPVHERMSSGKFSARRPAAGGSRCRSGGSHKEVDAPIAAIKITSASTEPFLTCIFARDYALVRT